jgi:peptidyl-prolyl cis-trans isomerase C
MNARMGMVRTLASTVVLATLAAAATAQQQAPPAVQAAAMVNGEVITTADVKALLDLQPPPATPLSTERQRDLRHAALNKLIEDALMRQFLARNVPAVTPADVDKELADLQGDLKQQKSSLEEYLKETGQTLAQLRRDITSSLQWKAYLTPRMPEQAVKAYYDANKVFFDKIFVKVSHLVITLPPDAKPADRQAVQARMTALRQEIVSGKLDFADAAKRHSDCTATKDKGGDLGFIPYKFVVVEPIARAAFALKVGEVSHVVASEFGLHLLKVTGRTQGEPSNYEAIKEQVRQIFADEVYQDIITQQRRASKIEVHMP